MSDLELDQRKEMETFYSQVLTKSRLQWRDRTGSDDTEDRPILAMVPDNEGDNVSDNFRTRITPNIDYDESIKCLRRQVFSLKRSPLSQTR